MGTVKVVVGDIVGDELLHNHDLIVNPTNPRMVCGAGVSQAIFHKAGVEELENYTQQKYNISYFTEGNLMNVGEVRITPGFNLGLDIMFVQSPRAYDYEYKVALNLLFDAYKNIVDEATRNGYKNVLCPSLGTGSYGFEHKNIGRDVVKLLSSLTENKDINVDLVLYDEADRQFYES